MNNKKYIFIFANLLFINNIYAYQIASNHSYIKNSTFTTDYLTNITGYGDFRFSYKDEYNDNKEQSTKLIVENEISININVEKEIDEITRAGIHYIPTLNNDYAELERYYGYIDGYYGKIEFGNTTSIYNNMKIGADTIAVGSGGINSNFIRNIKLEDNVNYILSPNSFMSQNFGFYNNTIGQDNWNDTKYLAKVNYYSPEVLGFQFGIGITPNVKLKQDYIGSIVELNSQEIDLGTFLNYGISYINTFDNVGIALSFVGEQNEAFIKNKENDIEQEVNDKFSSLEFGVNINYFGLTIAGSIGSLTTDINTSSIKNSIMNKGSYKTYGFAYEISNMSISVTKFESEYKDYSKFDSISYAVEKSIDKGISLYAEYTDYLSKTTGNEKKGSNVFFGVILNFD